LQPDWVHTLAARRVAAGILVILAAVAAVRTDPHGEHRETLVAAHDLTPGVPLTADDIEIENRLATTLPDGSQTDADAAVGATVAGPVRRGEVITDVRLLGAPLAESVAGPNARVVPLHLADNAVVDLIRAGNVVDILAAPVAQPDATPRVIATDAVVVSVSAAAKSPTAINDRVVLVALPVTAAHAVAGASLVHDVTLTLH
jgi:hypothetical protein